MKWTDFFQSSQGALYYCASTTCDLACWTGWVKSCLILHSAQGKFYGFPPLPLITHPWKENLFIMTLTKLKDTIVSFYLGSQKLHEWAGIWTTALSRKRIVKVQSLLTLCSFLKGHDMLSKKFRITNDNWGKGERLRMLSEWD